jgi:NAD(P)-dependent dehydrogenase (short-subunit alcohol dehydrogenase family)
MGAPATLTMNVAFLPAAERIRVNGLNIGWMDSPGEAAIQAKDHTADPDWLGQAEAQQPFGLSAYLTHSRFAGCPNGSLSAYSRHLRTLV